MLFLSQRELLTSVKEGKNRVKELVEETINELLESEDEHFASLAKNRLKYDDRIIVAAVNRFMREQNLSELTYKPKELIESILPKIKKIIEN